MNALVGDQHVFIISTWEVFNHLSTYKNVYNKIWGVNRKRSTHNIWKRFNNFVNLAYVELRASPL